MNTNKKYKTIKLNICFFELIREVLHFLLFFFSVLLILLLVIIKLIILKKFYRKCKWPIHLFPIKPPHPY